MGNDKVWGKGKGKGNHVISLGRFIIGRKVLTNLSGIREGRFLGSGGSTSIRGDGYLVTSPELFCDPGVPPREDLATADTSDESWLWLGF